MRFHVEFVQLGLTEPMEKKKLDIFKNDGVQFCMVHLFDDWCMSTRGGLQTLILGLKSVENQRFILTTQSQSQIVISLFLA